MGEGEDVQKELAKVESGQARTENARTKVEENMQQLVLERMKKKRRGRRKDAQIISLYRSGEQMRRILEHAERLGTTVGILAGSLVDLGLDKLEEQEAGGVLPKPKDAEIDTTEAILWENNNKVFNRMAKLIQDPNDPYIEQRAPGARYREIDRQLAEERAAKEAEAKAKEAQQ